MIIGNKYIINVFVAMALLTFLGCNSFERLSRKISKKYDDRNSGKFDLKVHHPNRVKEYRTYGLKDDRDSMIFIQYFNVHNGKIYEVFLNGEKSIFLESKDDIESNKIEMMVSDSSTYFPHAFVNAVKAWDTTNIYSFPEEHNSHQVTVFISKIVNGKIDVLRPRTYDFTLHGTR